MILSSSLSTGRLVGLAMALGTGAVIICTPATAWATEFPPPQPTSDRPTTAISGAAAGSIQSATVNTVRVKTTLGGAGR